MYYYTHSLDRVLVAGNILPAVSHTEKIRPVFLIQEKQELAGQSFLIRRTNFSCFSHSALIKNETKQKANRTLYCEAFRNHRKIESSIGAFHSKTVRLGNQESH